MYSDDTDTAFALGSSLATLGRLDGPHAAKQYATFFFDETCAKRFRPATAERVCEMMRDGGDYRKSGLPPHFPYAGGSFANGGAMRIWPLGIAFRSASSSDLRNAVEEAIRSSHVHPEAVDLAFAVAYSVALVVGIHVEEGRCDFDPQSLLKDLAALMRTPLAKSRIDALQKRLTEVTTVPASTEDDVRFLRLLIDGNPCDARPGSGFDFQLASVDMLPCVLWIACRYHSSPEEAIMRAVALGGDTDTTACMVGAILGALHGASWIPQRWLDGLENGSRGRDWAIGLAERLSLLDLRKTSTWGGEDAVDLDLQGQMATDFQPGTMVRLVGLEAQPKYNGVQGILAHWHLNRERWQVHLDDGTQKLLRVKNLEPSSRGKDVPKAGDTSNDASELPNDSMDPSFFDTSS